MVLLVIFGLAKLDRGERRSGGSGDDGTRRAIGQNTRHKRVQSRIVQALTGASMPSCYIAEQGSGLTQPA